MLNENDPVATYLKAFDDAKETLFEYKIGLLTKRREDFLAAGGCVTCNGQGNVCVWSTLDCVNGSYDEFGPCPDCDGNQTPWAGVNKRRAKRHPKISILDALTSGEKEEETLSVYENAVELCRDEMHMAEARWEIVKGSQVEVVRGRKTPKGTIGTVFWMGAGTSGRGYYARSTTRVGIKTNEGVTFWVNEIEYLKLLNPRTKVEMKLAGQEAMRSSGIRSLVRKGVQIDAQRVSGAVSWAGFTKQGDGPWKALVKAQKQDFWLDANEIKKVDGKVIIEALAA